MYEVFEKLLNEKGVSAYKVAKEAHVGRSTFTDWQSGRSKPKGEKLQKIADYFGVSVDYLLTGEEPNSKFTTENAHLVAKIRQDEELAKALEKYFAMPEDKKKHVIDTINMLSEE